MRFRWFLSLIPAICAAQTFFSVPPPDAPELAARGKYSVGVRTAEVTHAAQPDILRFDAKSGKAPLSDRKLTLEIWYPATIPAGQQEQTTYRMPGQAGESFEFAGKALRDAPPVNQQRFPLVIVSHGYPGSRLFLTWLTENLASKGYVAVAIDHTDSVLGDIRPFPSTLLNRSADQLFVLEATATIPFLRDVVDVSNVAIVGYSMGGYGALTSAGAGISKTSELQKVVPGGYLSERSADNPNFQAIDRRAIKAVVAIAPWGKQPPYSAWDAEGLAKIRVPSLFIAGDHDDVADYPNGIRPAFDEAIHSDRYLLVFQNARHNTGGNPPPSGITLDQANMGFFEEPVWRKDKITAINQHFITAFLDLHLKGDATRREYLDLTVPDSNQGKWVLPRGTQDTGLFSTGKDAEGNLFWKGFQRRWALGLELIHQRAKE